MYFTRSKDYSRVYAFVENWQGKELVIPTITPKKGSKVFLLGYDTPLQWSQTKEGIKVLIPDALQVPENRPCKYAWGFRIEVK
jgi:alpha-L-fucosidase